MSKIISLVLLLVLVSCTQPEPQIFGVNQSVWITLSESERAQIIASYNRQKEIEENNRLGREALVATEKLLKPLLKDNN